MSQAEKKTSPRGTGVSMSSLFAAPKGNLEYQAGEPFLLHVFWEAPSLTAARRLLEGLRQCAHATHRDTPCVPTYFFRLTPQDNELCAPPPRTLNEHPHIAGAFKKLRLRVPPLAVSAELKKRGIDPSLLDLDPDSALPVELQQHPVAVEFTEIYLDERAFMEHVGSRDYMDGYGIVMDPALHYRPPRTLRLGTPKPSVVEKILEPILRESVQPTVPGAFLFRVPSSSQHGGLFLSADFAASREGEDEASSTALIQSLSAELRDLSSTCVAFPHPLRANTVRLQCVFPALPSVELLSQLTQLRPLRGELHVMERGENGPLRLSEVRAACEVSGLSGTIAVSTSEYVGYPLHERAAEVQSKPNE